MTTIPQTSEPTKPITAAASRGMSRRTRNGLFALGLTGLTLIMLLFWLAPLAYMFLTSVKSLDQIQNGQLLPSSQRTFEYDGKERDVFNVPLADGSARELAMVKPGRETSTFVDPSTGELVEWEGKWRTLAPAFTIDFQWQNYREAFTEVQFPRLFRNTALIALFGIIGTVVSCTLVAYGFARFPIPYKNILFLILIATIILPRQVTLIPTYAIFQRLGWVGTWLPLIVPHFFANAFNVFLLRQYFLTIPREMDEAAMIDGASPPRVLWSVILPQAWPVIIAVCVSHMIFAWNDYFEPLIYLRSEPQLQPISVGIQEFNFIYATRPDLLQAVSLLALLLPVLVFFLAQRYFMQGVVFTGVDK